MTLFLQTLFGSPDEAVQHVWDMLSAEVADGSLSDQDRQILASEFTDAKAIPEEVRAKTTAAMERLLLEDSLDEFEREPRSLASSIEWIGERSYPNVVALAEELLHEQGVPNFHRLEGWKRIKDRTLVVLCGLLVVLLMFVIGAGIDGVFSK